LAELDKFFDHLLKERNEYQNKSALEKANRWVKAKLNERRTTPAWLTSLRK
jgi:hypothetical protein